MQPSGAVCSSNASFYNFYLKLHSKVRILSLELSKCCIMRMSRKARRQNSGEKLGFGETGERTRPEPKKTSEVNFNEDLCTCGDVKSVLLCFTWHYLYNSIDQEKKTRQNFKRGKKSL